MTGKLAHQLSDDHVTIVLRPAAGNPSSLRVSLSEAKRFGWALLADVDPDNDPAVMQIGGEAIAGDLHLDGDRKRVMVGERLVSLTVKEFDVLWALVCAAGRPLSAMDLEVAAYGSVREKPTNAIDVWIHKLRKKLAAAGIPNAIENRRGHGFMIKPSLLEDAA